MRKTILAFLTCAAVSTVGIGAASAFPIAPIGQAVSPAEQVRLVCDQWGRCWRTRPRYYRHGYAPRRFYGPGYGYYGPRYGYYGGPGVRLGGPGFGLHFGF